MGSYILFTSPSCWETETIVLVADSDMMLLQCSSSVWLSLPLSSCLYLFCIYITIFCQSHFLEHADTARLLKMLYAETSPHVHCHYSCQWCWQCFLLAGFRSTVAGEKLQSFQTLILNINYDSCSYVNGYKLTNSLPATVMPELHCYFPII